jgi:WD40 repeat protein
MADIFLSHASADANAADKIKRWLTRDRSTWSVFLDQHARDGILAGQSWQDRLRGELESCRVVLAIITPNWLASRWCFTEAVTSTFRGKDFFGIVPMDLPGEILSAAPPIVHERQRQPVNLDTGDGWPELLNALDHSGLDPDEWFPVPAGIGPYPGFVAFEEREAGVFYGRSAEITQYLDELNVLRGADRAQALVISGGSGSGKSSLLKAGLIPRLRKKPDWVVIPPFDPSREPVHALFSAIRTTAERIGATLDLPQSPPESVDDLTALLQNSLRAIEQPANAWLLVPLDQAEVLVADAQSGKVTDAQRLMTALGTVLASRARKLVSVLTIRTEFVPALQRTWPTEVRLRDAPLRPMSALSEVIEKPAERFGIRLEAGFVGRIVEDTRGGDALPLLAYTLRELYEKHGRESKRFNVAQYEELGGVEGAIERKIREALSDPAPTSGELAALRRCFVRHLIRVDETAIEGARYLRTHVPASALPHGAARLVRRLVDAALLVQGEGTISIAHERLIGNWSEVPVLKWLAEDNADRRLLDSLRFHFSIHRNGGPLLSGKPLVDATDFLEREPSLSDDEPELVQFIHASATAERRRKIRQKWIVRGAVAASLVFLAVSLAAVTFFLRAQEQTRAAQRQASIARGQLLAVQARMADEYPQRHALLAAEAVRATRLHDLILPSARQALRDVVTAYSGVGLTGHERGLSGGGILAVAISPDNAWLATASRDRTVRLWNLNALDPSTAVRVLRGHEEMVDGLRFAPDNRRLATGSRDRTVRLWDLTAADPNTNVRVLRHQGIIDHVAISGDNRWLVAGGSGVWLWDLTVTGPNATPRSLSKESGINALAISFDNHWLVTGGFSTVTRWDLSAEDPAASPQVLLRDRRVYALAISPDGRWLAAGNWLWDLSTTDPSATVRSLEGHEVFDMAISGDGRWLVTGGSGNTARVWDLSAAGPNVAVDVLPHGDDVHAVAISPDSRWLATGSGDNTVRLWDLSAPKRSATVRVLRGHEGGVFAAAISADSRWLMTGSEDGTARLWDLHTDEPSTGVTVRRHPPRSGEVLGAGVSGNHLWLVKNVGMVNRTLLYDLNSPDKSKPVKTWAGRAVTFSRDNRSLVALSPNGALRLVDLSAPDSGAAPRQLPARQVDAIAISQDRRWLATLNAGSVQLWDLTVPDPVTAAKHVLPGDQGPFMRSVAIGADGRWLSTGSTDGSVRLWDLRAANPRASIQRLLGHERAINALAISPDNQWLATASADGTARLWSLNVQDPGTTVRVLRGHEGAVNAVAISADNRWLATASSDDTARLWDLSALDPSITVEILRGHQDDVNALAFSEDSRRLMSSSADGTVRVWDVDTSDLVDRARRIAGRNLSAEEWQQYFPGEEYRRTFDEYPEGRGVRDRVQASPGPQRGRGDTSTVR